MTPTITWQGTQAAMIDYRRHKVSVRVNTADTTGASTLVGALTSALGVTLPFAFYTGMSSIIAVLIGPVGWIGSGLATIWKLDANYNRLVPAVLYICTLRTKQPLRDGDC